MFYNFYSLQTKKDIEMSNPLNYSKVVQNGMIIPFKEKFTLRDVTKVLKSHPGLSIETACFIVICAAIYHDVSYSKAITELKAKQNTVAAMF